ncbi:unnamed protein product [Bursaphelenchus xylophilus]|uniref:(pine wood nematode) hypothetical protein n=1 Tax=Bursaphelenchus xylophilus TaxID=6326 RepID=A0A811LKD3_BURXY|nr:unnamed protein product [Bursaphelenchus xylophilus]CAG9118022.1 unnamed protein product [Bursaphelenchus xylophilus]
MTPYFVFLLLLFQPIPLFCQTQGGGSYGVAQPYGSPTIFSNLPPQYQQYAQTYQQYQHLLPEAQRRQYESYFQQLSAQYNAGGAGATYQPVGGAGASFQPAVGAGANFQPASTAGINYQQSGGAGINYQPQGYVQPVQTSYSGFNQPVQPPYSRLIGYPTAPGVFTPSPLPYNTNQVPYPAQKVQVLTEEEYKSQRDRGDKDALPDYKSSFQQDPRPARVIPIPIQTVASGYPTGPIQYSTNPGYQQTQLTYQQYPAQIQPQLQYNRDCYPAYSRNSNSYFYPARGGFGPPPPLQSNGVILPSQPVLGTVQGYSSQPYVQNPPVVNVAAETKSAEVDDAKIFPRPTTKSGFSNIEDEFDHFKKIDTDQYPTGPPVYSTTTLAPKTTRHRGNKVSTTSTPTSTTETTVHTEAVTSEDELVEATSTGDIPLRSAEIKEEHWKPAALNAVPTSNVKFPLPKSLHDYQEGYGVNAGVYAGINGNQASYGNVPGFFPEPNRPPSPLAGRPYGPTNTNVGGSYGGLSPWPFMPPSAINTGANTTTTQPTNFTVNKEHHGTVRQIPIKSLVNKPENDDKQHDDVLLRIEDQYKQK